MLKHKFAAQRLSPKEFKDLYDLMRLWPESYRKELGKLFRHMTWLEAQRDQAENDLRQFKQVKLDDQIVKAAEPPKVYVQPERKKFNYIPAGQRFYELLLGSGGVPDARIVRWSGRSAAEIIKLANEWAQQQGKPTL